MTTRTNQPHSRTRHSRKPNQRHQHNQPHRRRLSITLVLAFIAFLTVIGRLLQLQVMSAGRYEAVGQLERIHKVTLLADRGSIFDRNGHALALSVPQETIVANPRLVKDPYQTAAELGPVVGVDVNTLQDKLRKNAGSSFMYVARLVSDDVAQKVKQLNLPGITMYEEPKQFLPDGSLAASVVGQVGVDNNGLSGLEKQYDKTLEGRPGSMVAEQDGSGRDIPGGLHKEQPSQAGDDLVLTLDSDLQHKTQTALAAEIQKSNAKGGMAAVMDTQTGEVLALVNLTVSGSDNSSTGNSSTGNGNAATNSTNNVVDSTNNMALTNSYEPGSVSKLITISAALQNGIVTPSTPFTVPTQTKVADATFHDAEDHPLEHWTTTDILANSSNVGTIGIAQKLGAQQLDRYQRAFGYGSSTGLQFPNESPGIMLAPKDYSGTSLATLAIGQGVAVTAMQMLAAYNTVANNGIYVQPKLVKATIDQSGKQHDTQPSPTRQVVSAQTAQQMNLMLREVVRVGTATAAQIDGYDVAGKTGTARKPKPGGGGYQDGAYISTFAGFVPAEKPRFTAIVVLDQPTPIFGGLVAAPVFADISRWALQNYGVAPVAADSDRHGVPFASPQTAAGAGEADAPAGTTAAAANAATINANLNANKGTSQNPGSSPTSTSTTAATVPGTNAARRSTTTTTIRKG